jgi:hypothetical protein
MTEETTTNTERTPQQDQIQQRLSYLEQALLEQDPRMKDHLKEIHRLLITHEELVHLLSEEEIGKIMQGQQIITDTTLVAAVSAPKARAAAVKKAGQLSLGDL